ncbi:MAG: DUF1080 domain-containing protein [Verrucomicrobiota bacterium]
MKTQILFTYILCLASAASLFGQEKKEAVAIFDGKTLDGWNYDPKVWRVEDGIITGGSRTEKIKKNYFISTKKSYQNFDLKLKIKVSGDPTTGMLNSGIQIRSMRVPGGAHMSGYQIDCGKGWFGKIYDEFRRNKVIAKQVDAVALDKVVEVYGWNEYRILAEGSRIRTWINGVLAIDYTEQDKNIALDGLIGPQVHSGGVCLVEVKDVTIRELPATPDASTWQSLGGVEAARKLVAPRKRGKLKGKKPKAKARKKVQSERSVARSPAEQLAGFTVAEGFEIELVASEENGVINPIDLAFDDAGRLWTQTARMYPLDPVSGIKWGDLLKLMDDPVAQAENPGFARIRDLYRLKNKGEDKILILKNPAQAAKGLLHVWADGLSIPQSILPYKDGAYVAHGSELFLLRDTDGNGKSDKMEPVLSGFGFTDTHTMSHVLVRAPGSWINFSQGALNKGEVEVLASGQKLRVDYSCQLRFALDHKTLEIVSTGPNNMWGLQLRGNGQWYGTEANDLGYSIVPFESGTAIPGIGRPQIRPYQPPLPNLHSFRVGGTGISALAFSDDLEGGFSKEWKDVALLGNPITSTINAVRINRRSDGSVEAEHLPDFLTSKDDWFRPVNMEFGPDGCLYIVDFYNKIISHNEVSTGHPDRDRSHGRIWRVRHKSQTRRNVLDVSRASSDQLLTHLQAPILWEKRAAWHQIVDRGLVELAAKLVELAANRKVDAITRIHALWSLEGLDRFDAGLLGKLVKEQDRDLRREAVRSLMSFDILPGEVAALLADSIEDGDAMVRSQALRTLGGLRQADESIIALLISACKPALEGNAMGGSYERNLERFLARKALEKFPTQLKNYLQTKSGQHPAGNILWAIQTLDDHSKTMAFLAIWKKVSKQKLDAETFVAIVGMLNNKEVYTAVAAAFQDPDKAEYHVGLALNHLSRVQSPQLIRMLVPLVRALLDSPETLRLGLGAVAKLKIRGVTSQLAKVEVGDDDELLRLLMSAQSVEAKKHVASFKKIAGRKDSDFDLRVEAAFALTEAEAKSVDEILRSLVKGANGDQKRKLTSVFSQSKPGAGFLMTLYTDKLIAADDFDLSAAERTYLSSPRSNPAGRAIFSAVKKRITAQRARAQGRIKNYMAYIKDKPGDPVKGKLVFGACLACHKVGSEGLEIAPPLDGSGHRELEHLLTAIVDPDAAVEGGHGLYRISKTDGSTVEGHLEKVEASGTTIAMMGGARFFVPLAEIKKGAFVGGRSFMVPSFGQLPEEMMADLVAYIATLK